MNNFEREHYEKYLSVNHSPTTVKNYTKDVEEYLNYTDTERLLWNSVEGIERYTTAMQDRNYSAATIARKLYSIKTYMKWINQNNDMIIQIPKVEPQREHREYPITLSDIQTLFEMMTNDLEYAVKERNTKNRSIILRDIALFQLIISTGISLTEVTEIEMRDIDYYKRLLTIRGKRCPRTLKITEKTCEDITNYAIAMQWVPRKTMFVNSQNGKISQCTINKIISQYFDRLGLNCSPKQLRTLAIKTLVEKKIPPETVEKLIGRRYINRNEILEIPE